MGILETRPRYAGQQDNLGDTFSRNATDQPLLKHSWFLDTFQKACREKGINPDLRLTANLAATLEDWIDRRLSETHDLGNKRFHDDKPSTIKEKLAQIISEWEFMEISSPFGEKIQVPESPNLEFLITYREAIFAWIREVRQRATDALLAQWDQVEQPAQARYKN